MKGDKKGAGKLATYAVIMLLAAIIIIIIAAMADDREQKFQTQIDLTSQTNIAIQNEIVTLKDENYSLKQENDTLAASVAEHKTADGVLSKISESLVLCGEGKRDEAKKKFAEIDKESLPETLSEIYRLAEEKICGAK